MGSFCHSLAGGGSVTKSLVRGTHRLITPEATVERIRPFMPVLGITRVANLTGLDAIGIPTVAVYRPNSRSLAVSQGKGLSLAAARASGLMESLELFHAERIDLPLRFASCRELAANHRVVAPADLPQPRGGLFHENLVLLWVEGLDLLHDQPVWLPFERVHLNSCLPLPAGSGCFSLDSNGLASGNHLLEAISHSLCELVERDSLARFLAESKAEQARRRLDVDTVKDVDCLDILGRYERAGVAVAVWEITRAELGIPAFHCVILEREADSPRAVGGSGGMGCHPTRHIALLRALTEAAQSRLTMISGARDDLQRSRHELIRAPDVLASLRADVLAETPVRSFAEAPSWECPTLDGDVTWLLERLQAAGYDQVVMVDLTHPGLQIPVVRMAVPGLRGIVFH